MTSSRDRKDGQQNDPPREEDQVAPTIVGGRPLRNRNRSSTFPLGIEVLLKKASVDPEFRRALVEKKSAAAAAIGLELSPSEAAALDAVPQSHIEKIIDRTAVPDEHRRVFLGKVAAAVLALLGIPLPAASEPKKLDVAWQFDPGGGDTPYTYSRLHSKPGRLNVSVSQETNWSMIVNVNYDCPFDSGELKICFRRDDNSEGAAITVVLRQCPVSKGKGSACFFVKGKDGETQWLLVGIRSTTADCVNAPWEFVDWRDHRENNREYYSRGCALCRVVSFVKKWA